MRDLVLSSSSFLIISCTVAVSADIAKNHKIQRRRHKMVEQNLRKEGEHRTWSKAEATLSTVTSHIQPHPGVTPSVQYPPVCFGNHLRGPVAQLGNAGKWSEDYAKSWMVGFHPVET